MPIDKLLETMEWGVEETLMIQKIFRPTGTIGDDFLPDWPANLMARGEYNHVDLMVGYTKDEALMQTLQLVQHPELYLLLAFQWYDVFGPMFLFGRYGPDMIGQGHVCHPDRVVPWRGPHPQPQPGSL